MVFDALGVGGQAPQAALRFLLYTMAGSFLMLVAIWSVAATAGAVNCCFELGRL